MATFSFVLTYNFKLPTLLLVLREKKLSIHLIDIPCINVDCMLKSEGVLFIQFSNSSLYCLLQHGIVKIIMYTYIYSPITLVYYHGPDN